jgi:hypothetical protein
VPAFHPRQFGDPAERFRTAIGEIVDHEKTRTCLQQFKTDVTADEAGTPGDQQVCQGVSPWNV